MVTITDTFLGWCSRIDTHPLDLGVGQILEFIRDGARGQAKQFNAMLNMLTEIAHGSSPYKGNTDLKSRKRRQVQALLQARRPIPIADANRRINLAIYKAVKAAGGHENLPTAKLADFMATKLAAVVGFRGTGQACFPWYNIRREPTSVSLPQCIRFYPKTHAAKGELLSEDTAHDAWSPEVEVSQNPHSTDQVYLQSRLSLLLHEWLRRIRSDIGASVQPTMLHGIEIWCNCIYIPRDGGKRKNGSERWNYNPVVSMNRVDVESRAATVRKRIERVLQEAGLWQEGVRPSDLRKYYATIFYEAWVKRDESKWDDLRRRMRHSSTKVTRKHYIQRELHPDIRLRWEALGEAGLLNLSSEELLGW
jgi:hypothetical protein